MSKRALTLKVRMPNFMKDAYSWRRGINAAIFEAQAKTSVQYLPDDKLEVDITFFLRDRKLTILDLDNRVKDVLDALQGFVGEKGKTRALKPIIPNDNQVWSAINPCGQF
jgi:hypothetical protein